MSSEKLELYGVELAFSEAKAETNTVRFVLSNVANNWERKIADSFFSLFENLDDFYLRSDAVANQIRTEAIDEALKCLVAKGVYDISEQIFYERFMAPYESWENDIGDIIEMYEAIAGKSAELDAYRTARREGRRQWVGYGAKEAVYEADAKNLISNVGHGVFNMLAKGVTAIGDSLKKDEIFKNQITRQKVARAANNLAMSAFYAAIDVLGKESKDSVYIYSKEELDKTDAIIENIRKDRIPQKDVQASLIKAISIYPYNESIYLLMLQNFGGDGGRLDRAAAYFGMHSLSGEKKSLFCKKLREYDQEGMERFLENRNVLEEYAKYLGYESYEADFARSRQSIASKMTPAVASPAADPMPKSHQVKASTSVVLIVEDSLSDRKYQAIGKIEVSIKKKTMFHKDPTKEQANEKLVEKAVAMGADAVINVAYKTGVGFTTWGYIDAVGIAVKLLDS